MGGDSSDEDVSKSDKALLELLTTGGCFEVSYPGLDIETYEIDVKNLTFTGKDKKEYPIEKGEKGYQFTWPDGKTVQWCTKVKHKKGEITWETNHDEYKKIAWKLHS
eukprot:gnl/MRDRNA2_/MRDRNA2_32867_c0_seq1.p2 gnl/MRDRNA2_/MRDRNA2_32867_c0~~gnl/MRDRNA2_/MRDRNA2_32867_c0_seq1.p2  ORF type:complete len:107 (-),score=17.73 gnl/MRDRNA2_/MRDRNA2_32867_c0_seq1:8-328(-)